MEKMKEFFKTLGAIALIVLLIAAGILCVIGELFPALLPDWVFVVCAMVCIPFWIWFFVMIFKQWRGKRACKNNKKESA